MLQDFKFGKSWKFKFKNWQFFSTNQNSVRFYFDYNFFAVAETLRFHQWFQILKLMKWIKAEGVEILKNVNEIFQFWQFGKFLNFRWGRVLRTILGKTYAALSRHMKSCAQPSLRYVIWRWVGCVRRWRDARGMIEACAPRPMPRAGYVHGLRLRLLTPQFVMNTARPKLNRLHGWCRCFFRARLIALRQHYLHSWRTLVFELLWTQIHLYGHLRNCLV